MTDGLVTDGFAADDSVSEGCNVSKWFGRVEQRRSHEVGCWHLVRARRSGEERLDREQLGVNVSPFRPRLEETFFICVDFLVMPSAVCHQIGLNYKGDCICFVTNFMIS